LLHEILNIVDEKAKKFALYLAGVNPGKLMNIIILCLNNLFLKAASVKHKTKTYVLKS